MSKKRKTRKQKERAVLHKETQHEHLHIPVSAPTYTIEVAQTTSKVENTKTPDKSALDKDVEYLKQDIVKIAGASGIILAFDILLFVLLNSGTLKLHFLGY